MAQFLIGLTMEVVPCYRTTLEVALQLLKIKGFVVITVFKAKSKPLFCALGIVTKKLS
jgi:hypothetical protein